MNDLIEEDFRQILTMMGVMKNRIANSLKKPKNRDSVMSLNYNQSKATVKVLVCQSWVKADFEVRIINYFISDDRQQVLSEIKINRGFTSKSEAQAFFDSIKID